VRRFSSSFLSRARFAVCRPGTIAERAPRQPVEVSGEEGIRRFEQAIAPYVKQARATLPQSKQKFLKGLPKCQVFLDKTSIYLSKFEFEQLFLIVI